MSHTAVLSPLTDVTSLFPRRLTHVLEDAVSLQLGVSDLALQHHQLLFVLLFQCV